MSCAYHLLILLCTHCSSIWQLLGCNLMVENAPITAINVMCTSFTCVMCTSFVDVITVNFLGMHVVAVHKFNNAWLLGGNHCGPCQKLLFFAYCIMHRISVELCILRRCFWWDVQRSQRPIFEIKVVKQQKKIGICLTMSGHTEPWQKSREKPGPYK